MSTDPSASAAPSISPTAPPQATPDRPWLGLAHFTEADRDYFFGRDPEVRELTDRVRRAPLTVLYGVSGYGKSSILGAGLIPALGAAGHPIVLLRRCYDDLAERPLQADVIAACVAAIPGCKLPGAATLWEFFHDRSQPWFQRSADEDGEITDAAPWPVLLLDQFEEIFIKGEDRATKDASADARSKEAAGAFLTQLADLVENRPPEALRERLQSGSAEERRALVRRFNFQARPVRIALAVRDDFLARLERSRRAMPSLMEHRVELRLLSGPQAYKAVFEPGTKRPGLPPILPQNVAEAIVRAAAGAASDVPLGEIDAVPPILSLLCERLNDRRLAASPTPASIADADFSPGEAVRILGRFYDDKLRHHPKALINFLEDKLVSDSGFRENVTLDSAVGSLRARVPDVDQRLRQLVDDRVLVIEDRGGIPRVEFTHDTLARLALDRRAERQTRARRSKAIAWIVASLAVAGLSLSGSIWALNQKREAGRQAAKAREQAKIAHDREQDAKREKTAAEAATIEAKKQTSIAKAKEKEAESEKARALDLIRFMDAQVGEAFVDAVPVQLRERVSAQVDAFYTEHGALESFDEHQRMGYYLRKAQVHLAAVERYQKENFDKSWRDTYISWERESGAAALKEALRLGDGLAAQAQNKENRGIARDRTLAHLLFANLSTQSEDSKVAAEHLQAARALLDALVQAGPYSEAQLVDWMGLPNLDAAMGDKAAAEGDKERAHKSYQKALALQTELVARRPGTEARVETPAEPSKDKTREEVLEEIKKHLKEPAPKQPSKTR